jgi:hypothetical protein
MIDLAFYLLGVADICTHSTASIHEGVCRRANVDTKIQEICEKNEKKQKTGNFRTQETVRRLVQGSRWAAKSTLRCDVKVGESPIPNNEYARKHPGSITLMHFPASFFLHRKWSLSAAIGHSSAVFIRKRCEYRKYRVFRQDFCWQNALVTYNGDWPICSAKDAQRALRASGDCERGGRFSSAGVRRSRSGLLPVGDRPWKEGASAGCPAEASTFSGHGCAVNAKKPHRVGFG